MKTTHILLLILALLMIFDFSSTYYAVCVKKAFEMNQYATNLIYKFGYIETAIMQMVFTLGLFFGIATILEKIKLKIFPTKTIIMVLGIILISMSFFAVFNNFNIIIDSHEQIQKINYNIAKFVIGDLNYEGHQSFDRKAFCKL